MQIFANENEQKRMQMNFHEYISPTGKDYLIFQNWQKMIGIGSKDTGKTEAKMIYNP